MTNTNYTVTTDANNKHIVTLEGQKKPIGSLTWAYGKGWDAEIGGKKVEIKPLSRGRDAAVEALVKEWFKTQANHSFKASEPTTAEKPATKPAADKPANNKAVTNKQIAEMRAKVAEDQGRDTLLIAREALMRAVREMDSYIERYEGFSDHADKANAINWAINHLASGVMGNLRIDTMAMAQARLTEAANELRKA